MDSRMVDAEAQRSHEHTMAVTETSRNSRTSPATYKLGPLEDSTIDFLTSPDTPLLDQQG